MKKYAKFGAVIIFLLYVTKAADAVSVSVGGNLWYQWWQPAWEENRFKYNFVMPTSSGYSVFDFKNMGTDSSLLFGPVLSLRFLGRFSISSVFMYGKFNYNASGRGTNYYLFITPSVNPVVATIDSQVSRNLVRWDSDTTGSYSFSDYLYFFLGFKIQGYQYKEAFFAPPSFWYRTRSRVDTYGTGAGFGTILPLFGDLCFTASASAIVMWGFQSAGIRDTGSTALQIINDGKFLANGGTFTGGLIYKIHAVGTVVSVGFRYQLLKYYQRLNETGYDILSGKMERIYGLTFSAVYTLNFGG